MLSLKIRHYWDDRQRAAIIQQLNNSTSVNSPSSAVTVVHQEQQQLARKTSVPNQERAVDVPAELLLQQSAASLRCQREADEAPPPVPPRRRRRSKINFGGLLSPPKAIVSRSLSSDEVLVNGNRVPVPSKPPRTRLHVSRSFNSKEPVDTAVAAATVSSATLPRYN